MGLLVARDRKSASSPQGISEPFFRMSGAESFNAQWMALDTTAPGIKARAIHLVDPRGDA